MNEQTKAVIQQALEALEEHGTPFLRHKTQYASATAALRQLLEAEQACPHGADSACKECHEAAQPAPAQEPKAFLHWYDNAHWGNEDFKEGCHRSWDAAIKYATPPAQPVPVQEPVDSMGMPLSCGKPFCSPGDHHPLCKMYTPPAQTAPAPGYCKHCKQYTIDEPMSAQPAAWVGLTDEERQAATGWSVDHIESFLREKNGGKA